MPLASDDFLLLVFVEPEDDFLRVVEGFAFVGDLDFRVEVVMGDLVSAPVRTDEFEVLVGDLTVFLWAVGEFPLCVVGDLLLRPVGVFPRTIIPPALVSLELILIYML
jgi:hypothetical protein